MISEEERKKLEEAVASFEALQADLPPLPTPTTLQTEASVTPEASVTSDVPEKGTATVEQPAPKLKTTYVRKVQLKELQEKEDQVVIIRKGERS